MKPEDYIEIHFATSPAPLEPETPYQREAYTLRALVRYRLSWADWVDFEHEVRFELLRQEKQLDRDGGVFKFGEVQL